VRRWQGFYRECSTVLGDQRRPRLDTIFRTRKKSRRSCFSLGTSKTKMFLIGLLLHTARSEVQSNGHFGKSTSSGMTNVSMLILSKVRVLSPRATRPSHSQLTCGTRQRGPRHHCFCGPHQRTGILVEHVPHQCHAHTVPACHVHCIKQGFPQR
jgi:hypothetical protein